MKDKITLIDFNKQFIQIYKQRPTWMSSINTFNSFEFKARRIMLPARIEGRKLDLFYDSGSSAFGLITGKSRYKRFSEKSTTEIRYEANSWGNSVPIVHKATEAKLELGKENLPLNRVSYIDRYAFAQNLVAPFVSIGGFLGNKPFIESTVIFDTVKEEYAIFKKIEKQLQVQISK